MPISMRSALTLLLYGKYPSSACRSCDGRCETARVGRLAAMPGGRWRAGGVAPCRPSAVSVSLVSARRRRPARGASHLLLLLPIAVRSASRSLRSRDTLLPTRLDDDVRLSTDLHRAPGLLDPPAPRDVIAPCGLGLGAWFVSSHDLTARSLAGLWRGRDGLMRRSVSERCAAINWVQERAHSVAEVTSSHRSAAQSRRIATVRKDDAVGGSGGTQGWRHDGGTARGLGAKSTASASA